MKKLLLFLLTIISLQLQAQFYDYYPSYDDSWKQLRPVAYVVLKPANYDPTKTYPWMVFLHGMNDLGGGQKANLDNLLFGYSYDGGKTRTAPTVIPDFQNAVNKYGVIGIVPNYNTFFQPESWNYVIDQVSAKYKITTKGLAAAFSWGAGSLVKFIRSGAANASRLAVAIPIAATLEGGSGPFENVRDGGTLVWAMVNTGDDNGPTKMSVTQSIVASINATKPAVNALYTAFDKTGHGGTERALTQTPPVASGGQGFTTSGENVYEYYLDVLKDGPRQPKSTVTTTTPTTPVQPPSSNVVTAAFNIGDGQTVTTSALDLDGSASSNVSTSWDGYLWGVTPITGSWAFTVVGGAYGGPKKSITGLRNGAYSIVLTAKDKSGNTAQKAVTVIVSLDGMAPAEKVPASYDGATLLFTDGTKEAAVIIWDGKQVVAKTATKSYIL